ncbi:MAG: bacillithiol biosynthesis deacetylase BshB1 [Opitutaceae bacterium]|nr:bacillithiol biosynthesis deacetylase BshB1 [Cytophagales bacterium]
MKLDILAIAAHPDDVEISCSGTLLFHIAKGYKVGILDLTRGEMGTRGSAELRDIEAANSSKILGLSARHNIGLADCFFSNNPESQKRIITQIRRYQPEIVICNAPEDRHPDHGKGSSLAIDSCFYSGLAKVETEWEGNKQDAWRPKNVFHYIQDRLLVPDLVFDITPFWEKKVEALKAFKSQFYDQSSDEPETYISTQAFWKFLEARAREMGHYISVPYGEGFKKTKMLQGKDLLKF